MNFGKNPFNADPIQDSNFYAEEILDAIRSLNNSKAASCPKKQSDQSQKSENCLPSKNAFTHQIRQRAIDFQFNQKQKGPPFGLSIIRKRKKTQTEYDEVDINIGDSFSNKRITDYFGKTEQNRKEHFSKKGQHQARDRCQANPIIRSLRQKITKKKKNIEQLKIQEQKLKQKNIIHEHSYQAKMNEEREHIKIFLKKKYQGLIYDQMILHKTHQQEEDLQHIYQRNLEYLNQRIQTIEQQKKKKNNKDEIDESNHLLEYYGADRINYMKEWKKKLENEKNAIEKQLNKKSIHLQSEFKQYYYALPQFLSNSQSISRGDILPLWSRKNIDIFLEEQTLQVRCIHLETLSDLNLTIVPFLKSMKPQRKLEITSHFQTIYQSLNKSKELSKHSLSTPLKYFEKCENYDYFMLGHSPWPQNLGKMTLKNIMNRYESLNELIAKYIIKTILKAIEQIRSQCKIMPIILPENIVFNEKNQMKVDCWIKNQLIRFPEFSDTILADNQYLYFPPQLTNKLYHNIPFQSDTWTIGVLFYEMIYSKKPFNFQKNVADHEEFYILNEIEFPIKPSISQGAKQFMKMCFLCPDERMEISKALKHSYFDHKK